MFVLMELTVASNRQLDFYKVAWRVFVVVDVESFSSSGRLFLEL